MRFLLTNLLVVVMVLFNLGMPSAFAEESSSLEPNTLIGQSAILIDATTGQVLFEKNPHEKLYPASITKIATGIYAIEKGNLDDTVTVSKKARREEGTRVYLEEGEKITLRNLLYGLLMNSGNDAGTAIAEHMSQTTERFAVDLNAYLKEKVGVTETNFANPHGLHDPNHYTTAADMAKISRYAMKNPVFREIVGTKRLPWHGQTWETVLVNHNKLLREYEGATGIKNGFTDQAMHTLVGSAKRGETELIAVTMKASTSANAYKDIKKLLDFGFQGFETKFIAKKGDSFSEVAVPGNTSVVTFTAKEDLYATVPKGVEPLVELKTDGSLSVHAGKLAISYPLLRHDPPAPAPATIFGDSESGNPHPLARYSVLIVWLGMNLFLIAYTFSRVQRNKRIRERSLQRRFY
ncbi:peptidase S11 family protein precursor [Brevibacillus brevis NBRC 100599]|uniref:Peptidase S11 family protein n=1 Tax=Brevibacillus brevis (strain 47 / JCM 6285 / NBRC 100599) TaxID=358681 RepID=C0ZDZ7_BREBN|nr:D-alanyl-D-alanine carboxypeptidase family protein [Brevibacillus brevis]BAH44006.1 peptidase S11 family protein precursor [Brevibacillus brevis NBRC 100599]